MQTFTEDKPTCDAEQLNSEEKIERAKTISQNRILNQDDFQKLRAQQALNEVTPAVSRKASKRKITDVDVVKDRYKPLASCHLNPTRYYMRRS